LHVLQTTLHASTLRVEAETQGLCNEVFDAIKKNSSYGNTSRATTWKEWKDLTQNISPDCLILLIHIEKDYELDTDKMEIGEKDFLIKNYLNKTVITSSRDPKTPLAIVIGCKSADISNIGFDVSSQFINNGAAIVLSSFTKIRGAQAGRIIIKLVEFLKQNANHEIVFGEVMLKLRQHLLANGIMAGLALVSYGDADWKIKT
jgi:hypothetical protein